MVVASRRRGAPTVRRAAHRIAERRQDVRLREAADPGFFLRTANAELEPERLAAGRLCVTTVAELGQMVFEHEYKRILRELRNRATIEIVRD